MTRASAAVIALTIAAPAAFAQSTKQPPTPTPHERPKIYSSQPGQTGASELVGASVHAQSGELIGHVNDIILGNDGRVAVVVVGVSHVLGLGQREIAINDGFSILRDPVAMTPQEAITVIVYATEESLKAAPEWRWSIDSNTGRKIVTPQMRPAPEDKLR